MTGKDRSRRGARRSASPGPAAPSPQETVKIGVILPYSGPFADAANQLDAGIKLYMQQHGDEVAGKKIEIIRKDTGGPAPDVAKRLAQELVVRDGVDILAGFALTPEALGAADVATEAGKLMVVMNAATSIVTEKSPYIVRTSLTIPQLNYAFGKWAFEEGGVKQAYTLVADYGPGHDAESSFAKGFTEAGGTHRRRRPHAGRRTRTSPPSCSASRTPTPRPSTSSSPAAASRRRSARRSPTAASRRPPPRSSPRASSPIPRRSRAWARPPRGIITTFHYTLERDDPLNNEFVEGYRAANDGRSPDLFSIGGYDGMHLIYEALKKTDGDTGGDALVEAAKGMAWESPRGPMSIDPETRDVDPDRLHPRGAGGRRQAAERHHPRDPRREGPAARRQLNG